MEVANIKLIETLNQLSNLLYLDKSKLNYYESDQPNFLKKLQ